MHSVRSLIALICFGLFSFQLVAQTQISGIVNDYTAVTGYVNCDNAFTVANASAFSVGDRVLIIQMQGATVDQTEGPTFGQITDLGNAGNYEMGTISSITGNNIALANEKVRNYTFGTGKVQMVRVPQYVDAEVPVGGLLTCLPWNGTTGGILAIECSGGFYCNGEINVKGMGFRGGQLCNTNNNTCPATPNLTMGLNITSGLGAEKGEGIAAFVPTLTAGRGPWANGGGGGNKLNAGGGGGGNMGAGGQGGFQTGLCTPQVDNGGLGGYSLPYDATGTTPSRIFMGGGGGAGDFNDASSTPGGNGGGIIFIKAGLEFNTTFGFGFIDASGVDIIPANLPVGDGQGGGGGGGSIVIEAPLIAGSFFILNLGGQGGDNATFDPNDFGPGGGGGGGLVAFSGPPQSLASVSQFGGQAGDCTGTPGQPCYGNSNGAVAGETGSLLGNLIFPEGTIPFTGLVNGYLDTVLCVGESITISGNTFNAANPTGIIQYPGGSFFGCDSALNVTVTYFPNVTGTFLDTLCEGQVLTIGNTTFTQANPSGTAIINNGAVSGCDSTVNVTITYLIKGTSTIDSTLCPGQTLVIAGTTFSQANPNGTATIAGGSANGCDSIVTVSLTYVPQITANLSVTGAVCPGEQALITINLVNATGFGIGSVTITGDGGSDVQTFTNINSGFNFDVSPSATSTYTITAITIPNYDCTPVIGNSANVIVTNLNPTITILSDYNGFDVSCGNQSDGIATVTVNGTPPYQYLWSNGATTATATGLPSGPNDVVITDANGCSDQVLFNLLSPPPIEFDTVTTMPTCYGETDATVTIDTVFGGFSPYFVSFDSQLAFPLPDSGFVYTNLGSGNFVLTIYDDNDCSVEMPIFIDSPEELLVDIGNDTTINLGDSLVLNLQANFVPDTVFWSTLNGIIAIDTGTLTVAPFYETSYTLTAIDTVNGCSATATITVTISKDRKVFVPSIFSPNGDNNNDIFYIFADPKIVQSVNVFRIYDRWGTKVHEAENFQPNDPTFGWNGFHRGNLLTPQVFVYYFELTYIDGRTQFFEGDVTLLR